MIQIKCMYFRFMATPLSKEVVKLRKAKQLTQGQLADKLKLKRSTYAKKEAEGDFDEDDINGIVKAIGGNKEALIQLARDQQKISVEDWKEQLIRNAIDGQAMSRVILMALAEILAKQKNESLAKVLSELTRAVEVERGRV